MKSVLQNFSIVAISAATLGYAPAHAVSFTPGSTLNGFDYRTYGVDADDPDWRGNLLATTDSTTRVVRDGFVPPDVISDLYDVQAGITSSVTKSTTGRLVFEYGFSAETGFSPGFNGAQFFSVSGFAGYDIDFAWIAGPDMTVFEPGINRSADGDTLSFNFLDPSIPEIGGFERFLFAVNAPAFRTDGNGSATILVDTFGENPRTLTDVIVPSQIPLPASIFGLTFGLLGLRLLRRNSLNPINHPTPRNLCA